MAHASPMLAALGLSLYHGYGELMRGAGFDARPEAQDGTSDSLPKLETLCLHGFASDTGTLN